MAEGPHLMGLGIGGLMVGLCFAGDPGAAAVS